MSRVSGGEREDLDVLLVSISARLTRLYGQVLGQLATPLTFRQHRLLRRIDEGHSALAALAAFGNLTVPTVSESVEVLVRRGLINRQENPRSRRSLLLSLTPEGRAAKAAGDLALAEVGRRLLKTVPEERHAVLHESLASIYEAATDIFQHPDSAPAPPDGARR
ncbi:MarR family winged helix-turn-helix transcriptional regulator [Saccharopolyspora sp. K220]|uniref:MarR family winged helix-turn-helix transcriptional regulator n=1 Tax=Saccharopolyspora soli TaxID=2926618 RepID=UPI001F5A8049|nr:MarR family winged helix-turn-helix transcriptional regulator [Saccharopolyspora soli]MCI2423184.1 MarR family winged helix-turn-helix transcriptional regulator [Saccharopolyspora soli]